MKQVREQEKWAVIFKRITIAEGRIEQGAKLRNPPPILTNHQDKSLVVSAVVEAVRQQWAEDDQ